jgi:hypothetical protein
MRSSGADPFDRRPSLLVPAFAQGGAEGVHVLCDAVMEGEVQQRDLAVEEVEVFPLGKDRSRVLLGQRLAGAAPVEVAPHIVAHYKRIGA